MGRSPKFSADALLDVACERLLTLGPAGVSMTAIATASRAPSGSVYYRFPSRDVLLASLWLRAVERFQVGLLEVMAAEIDPVSTGRRVAAYALEWSRTHLDDARVLLLHRSRDLLASGWPDELADRNRAQLAQQDRIFQDLYRRLGARCDAARRRIQFAVVDIPYAAARPALTRGLAPEPELDEMVDTAVRALLARLVDEEDTRYDDHAR